MHRLWSFIAAVALLAAVTAGHAYPNLNATTGILAVPTASVVAPGDFIGAADVLFFSDTTLNARVIYGLTSRLEVGAGVIAGEDTALGLSAKYMMPGTIAGLNWALGGSIITASDIDDGFQIYAVGTRPIAFGDADNMQLLGTIGVNFTDIDTASAVRPFIGAQLFINDRTEISAEFVFETGDFTDSILSVLLRRQMSDRLTGQLGLTNAFGFTGSTSHDFFIGASYVFD